MNIKKYSKKELIELSKNHNARVIERYRIEEGGQMMLDMINRHTFEIDAISPYIELSATETISGHAEIFEFDWSSDP